MHLSSVPLTLAATDLGRFLACRHLTGLDVDVAYGRRAKPPKYPDPFLDLLINRGLAHEKDYLGKIEKAEARPSSTSPTFHDADAVERTLEAMKAGQPAIAQGALAARRLVRPARLPPEGRKAQLPRPLLLRSHRHEALPRDARRHDPPAVASTRTCSAPCRASRPRSSTSSPRFATEQYRVADFAAYYRLVKRRLVEAAGGDIAALLAANYPEPVDYCDVCRWCKPCDKRRHADDHLSLVAGITRLNRREFEVERRQDARAPRRPRPPHPVQAGQGLEGVAREGAGPGPRPARGAPRPRAHPRAAARRRRAAASRACPSPRPATSSSTSKATTSPRKARASTSSG